MSSPRAPPRTFSPILTGSFYGGTTAEAISKCEEGMFQRQSADGSDISQQYFSIIACYENLYRARPSIIELSSLFLSKFYSRSSLLLLLITRRTSKRKFRVVLIRTFQYTYIYISFRNFIRTFLDLFWLVVNYKRGRVCRKSKRASG